MRKNLLLLIFLFVIGFGFKVNVYAKKSYTIDVSGFKDGKDGDSVEIFRSSVCDSGLFGITLGITCSNFKCINEGAIGKDYSECNDYGGFSSFDVNVDKKAADADEFFYNQLSKLACVEGTTCLNFFKNNYCSNIKDDDFCKYITQQSGKPIDNGNSNLKNCPIALQVINTNHECSYKGTGINFQIEYSNNQDIFRFSNNFNDSNLIIQDTEATICDNKFFLHGMGKEKSVFKKNFFEVLEKKDSCPSILWCSNNRLEDGYYKFYAEFGETCDPEVYGSAAVKQKTDSDGSSSGVDLNLNEAPTHHSLIHIGDGSLDIFSCDTFFSDKKIVDIVKIIITLFKILVPIILIVMGVMDFVQAMAAQDDGAMKKAQNKFIRRIIIAVIIFLIPTLLNVVLKFASNVWPDVIKADSNGNFFCGIL